MRGQRYEINISAKDNYYKVEVLKNGWRLLAAEGDYNNVDARLSEVYTRRVNTKQFNDDTRAIEKSIRAFRGYAEC